MKKIFNKLISGIMCLGMVLAMLPIGAGAEYDYTKVVEVTTALNIIPEKINPDDFVTRKELAKFICYMLAAEDNGAVYNSDLFYDVDETNEYYKYISTMSGYGLMVGVSEGVFAPDEKATFSMVVKVLTDAAGYRGIVGENTATAYANFASGKGMLKNVTYTDNGYVKLGELAQLIWNTLKLNAVEDSIGTNEKVLSNSDLLWHYHKIDDASGRVTANENTYLNKDEKLPKGYIEIDNVLYKAGADYLGELLGKNVDFYYKADDASDEKVILWAEQNDTKTYIYDAKEIENVKKGEFTYKTGSTTKTHKLSEVINVIYNGTYLARFRYSDLMPMIGNVELIDSDSDRVFETAVVKSYIPYVVRGVDAVNRKIFDEGTRPAVEIDEEAKLSVRYNGMLTSLEAVEKEDVLLIAADKYKVVDGVVIIDSENSEIFEILVSKERITGVATEIESSEKTAVIEGENYDISVTYNDAGETKVSINKYSTFYIDAFSNVVYVKTSGGEAKRVSGTYGFVTRVRYDELEDKTTIRIFDENGTWNTYFFADKVRIDGVSYKEKRDMYDIINSGVYGQLTGGENDNGGFVAAFRINSEGKVNFLDTANPDPDEEEDINMEMSQALSSTYYYVGTLAKRFLMPNKNNVLAVPTIASGGYDAKAEEKYRWTNDDVFEDGYNYNIQVYNADMSGVAEIFIYPSSVSAAPEGRMYVPAMINRIITTVNEDNELVTRVSVSGGSGAKTIDINEKTNIFKRGNDGRLLKNDPTQVLKASDLRVGDIIAFVEKDGVATSVGRWLTIYDAKGEISIPQYAAADKEYGNDYSSSQHMDWGNLYMLDESSICILRSDSEADRNTALLRPYRNNQSASIVCFDVVNREVKTISTDEVQDYMKTNSLSNCDKVMINRLWGSVNAIFIFRMK